MTSEGMYTLDEAHLEFAKWSNGQVWTLLGKADRTPVEDEEMVMAAFASLYHWRYAGTEVHHQRGEWMIAHVFTVLGNATLALEYAGRCLALTESHKDQMEDFDVAYAYEGMARAHALAGNSDESGRYLGLARKAGDAIGDLESKEIFDGDFESGDWYGVA